MKKYLKTYMNSALVYAVLAMIGGVFYREFTKYMAFTGKTMLSFIHTHYFMLGMLMFLLLLILEKCFSFTTQKTVRWVTAYNAGLNLTVLMMLVRGILQVLETPLSKSANAAVSGIAGVGHIILGVSLFMILLAIKKAVAAQKN